jgi:hypothetical protein
MGHGTALIHRVTNYRAVLSDTDKSLHEVKILLKHQPDIEELVLSPMLLRFTSAVSGRN